MQRTFAIQDDFMLDGKPFKVISGAIHYFRVVPQYWRDRLEKLKAMGCNTVETYVAWNLHEPRKGDYCFEGIADLCAFLKTAQEVGLWAIVRPGPYICAEWEFGGLPAWLLADDAMRVRTPYEGYMCHVRDYMKELLGRVTPLQIDRGGPIIMMQVENEYGSYGNDSVYMEAMRDLMLDCDVTVPLITSDGPEGDMLPSGYVQGAHATANFGSGAKERLPILRKHLDGHHGGPLMVTEFWIGWFDAWGVDQHRTTDPAGIAHDLDEMLTQGSVNFYMFHGGTNFGLLNGGNYYDKLTPDVTSYDYDAPLSEDGRITPKYEALRAIIAKHAPIPEVALSTTIRYSAFGEAKVREKVSLFATLAQLSTPVEAHYPLPMEKLGQNYGYTLYESELTKTQHVDRFRLDYANDRAQVFIDGEKKLTLMDRELLEEHAVNWQAAGEPMRMAVLMENLGRVNYGRYMDYQRKGIAGAVLINAHHHSGWRHHPLELNAQLLAKVDYQAGWREGDPAFYRMCIDVDQVADTFLDTTGWGKGCVFLNGYALGRFWEIGPQKRLYIPAPLLRVGENEIVIFESEGRAGASVRLEGEPSLGPTA